jgi:hypothetical protein
MPAQDEYRVSPPGLGPLAVRKLDPEADLAALHNWFNQEYSRHWGLRGKSIDALRRIYEERTGRENQQVLIASLAHSGEPLFLFESYDPQAEVLGGFYDAKPGDRGLHFHMAPLVRRVPNLSYLALLAAMDHFFKDPQVQRVIAEPNIGNAKFITRALQAGFQSIGMVQLPWGSCQLLQLTRQRFLVTSGQPPRARPSLRWWRLRAACHLLRGSLLRLLRF